MFEPSRRAVVAQVAGEQQGLIGPLAADLGAGEGKKEREGEGKRKGEKRGKEGESPQSL